MQASISALSTLYLQSAAVGTVVRQFNTLQGYDIDAATLAVKQPIVLDVMTPIFDGNVRVKKTLTKLRILADRYQIGSLQIRWSDDDYQTWSAWTEVNLQQDSPFLANLGTFTRRAFQLRHNQASPFRLQGLEAELLLGSI